MSKKSNPALIGAFVVGAVALLALGILVFGGGRYFKETRSYVLHFDGSVKGLNTGAPVMFRGVTIGKVTDIHLLCDPKDLIFSIPIIIEIEPDLIRILGDSNGATKSLLGHTEDIIERLKGLGLRGQLQMQNLLTGKLFVQFDLHPDTPARYVDTEGIYSEIPTIPSNLQEITRALSEIPFDELFDRIMGAAEGIDDIVNSPELSGSIQSLERGLNEMRTTIQNADSHLSRMVKDFRLTLNNARNLLQNVDSQVVPVSRSTQDAALATRRALERAEELMTSLRDTTAKDSNLHYEVLNVIRELSDAARSLRLLAEYLEAHPESLIRGKVQGGGE